MKPLEILSALPEWSGATPDALLDDPAFAMPCRLGEESETLRFGAVRPAETIAVDVLFEDEPHVLGLARSPRFAELDAVWDSRADLPAPLLLALVEKDCGPFFQLLENAVRRQLKVVGLSAAPAPAEALCGQVADIVFTLTRTPSAVAALGQLRNLDPAHESVRARTLPCAVEYAAFALPPEDLASLAPGDALLLPEIGTVAPRLIADGRLVLDESGVSAYREDTLARVRGAEARTVTLGEVFDAAETPAPPPAAPEGAQLRLFKDGRAIASGRLERLGEQNAFVVEDRS